MTFEKKLKIQVLEVLQWFCVVHAMQSKNCVRTGEGVGGSSKVMLEFFPKGKVAKHQLKQG